MTHVPTGVVASSPFELVQQSALQQRLNPRFSFSAPLKATETDGTTRFVLCRDLSAGGIGLLCRGELATERLTIQIPTAFGSPLDIQAEPSWSHPIGSGWYISGAQFIGSSQRDRFRLWLSKRLESMRLRSSLRYPFYRQVKIHDRRGTNKSADAFSRDISTGGMGLVHENPIESETALLTVIDGPQVLDFRMKHIRSRQCGPGLSISGWTFYPRTRLMEQLQRY